MKKVIFSMIVLAVMILTGCGGSGSITSAVDAPIAINDASIIPNTGALSLPEVPQLPAGN